MEICKYTEWLMDNCEIVYDKDTGIAILWRYDCEEYSFNGIVDLYFRLTKEESKRSYSEEEVNLLHKSILMHLDDKEAEGIINSIFHQFKK